MKKFIVICVSAMFILAMGTAARAESSVSIGIKGWVNSWESTFSDGTSFDNGSALLLGPTVKFSSDKFFAGISYLASTGDYEANDVIFIGDTLTQDRQDLDLVLGFMLHPRVGILAGYKSITSSADLDLGFGSPYHIWDLSITGPALGVTANFPLGESGWVLVGSLSYLTLDATYSYDTGPDDTDDMTGTALELGAAYGISEHASLNVGFKTQTLSYDTWNGDEKFNGLTFGFDYRF